MTVAPPTPGGRISAPPPVDDGGRSFNAAIIQLLRQIMQNARDATESIDAFKGMVALGKEERVAKSQREFKQYDRNAAELDAQIDRASLMADEDPAFDVGDQVTLIQDAWNRAKDAMPAPDAFEATAVAASLTNDLDTAKEYIKKAQFLAARLSLPSQVRQYVGELRPGNTASIHDILKEDVPDEEQRKELILYLKTARISIPGIIDVATGTVTRYETNKGALRFSMLRVLLLAVGVPVLALLASWFWPSFTQLHAVVTPQQVSSFFPILMGVWAGAALHVLIDLVKARRGPRPDFVASVDDFQLYINSNEVPIIIGLVVLLVVAVGTAFVQPTLAFAGSIFIGYSADSIADVFLERFEKVVDVQTGAIKTVVGGA